MWEMTTNTILISKKMYLYLYFAIKGHVLTVLLLRSIFFKMIIRYFSFHSKNGFCIGNLLVRIRDFLFVGVMKKVDCYGKMPCHSTLFLSSIFGSNFPWNFCLAIAYITGNASVYYAAAGQSS